MNEQQLAAVKQALEALKLNNDEWKSLVDAGDAGYWNVEDLAHYKQTNEAIAAVEQALAVPTVQEPSPGGILFAVEQAINNGDCPFAIEIAFDAYEAERKALAGITAPPKKGQP
jgi:phosphoribosylformylglycinamidine (FGAM) synthase-like enzyme